MITFNELCDLRAEEVLKPGVLYELGGDLKWIKTIIHQYNKLKFLTWTSQPGSAIQTEIYETCYDRKYKIQSKTLKCTRLQRAFIRGYMHKSVADKLYKLLENHQFIFMKTTTHNRKFEGDVEFGSMSFLSGVPIYRKDSEADYNYSDEELKKYPDANESFRLGVTLHRPFPKLFKDYNFMEGTQIDEVEIFDIRWNDNSLLWTEILQLLEMIN